MGVLSFVVFIPLQILFIPLAVLGSAIVAYKQIAVSKRLRVSQTGIEVLNGRWAMHVFGMREDVATARLANVLPNTSTFGLWLALIPLWVKYKLSGSYFGYPRVPQEGAEGISDFVVARTLYFDRIIQRVVGDVEQFVLLGAGYDTRVYGQLKREGVACFELDQAQTQRLKISCLSKGCIDADHVIFVEVDFAQEDAFERLEAAGYDPSKKTLFLWEGVTLYLSEQDVRKTLRDVRDHSGAGSVLVADIYGDRFIQMVARGAMAKKTLEFTDEGLIFGLPFEADHVQSLGRLLESEGLTQGETYFMGTTHEKGPYMVVVECTV
jgi:methyltransferase (TIGR00027 family)